MQIVVSTMDLLARSKFRWRIEHRRMILAAGPCQEIILEGVDQGLWTVSLRKGHDLQPLTGRRRKAPGFRHGDIRRRMPSCGKLCLW